MKKIISLFSIIISTCYPQINPTVSDFLISGDDNTPSTFLQYAPELTVTNSRNFLMLWWDFREGNPAVFDQRFDGAGNKIDSNFNTNSNLGSYIKKNGYLLSLGKSYSTPSYFPYFKVSAALYNDFYNKIIDEEIFSGLIPECATGFIFGENLLSASDSCFYFLTNYGGNISLTKLDDKGNVKFFPEAGNNNITQITASAASDCNYFFAWVSRVEYDSLETNLYAAFIDSRDSIIVPSLFITKLDDSVNFWDYMDIYNLKSVALNDSVYKLFWLNNISSKLYSVMLDKKGEIISAADSLLIPGLTEEQGGPAQVILTNKNEDGFFLYISRQYADDLYMNNFIKYSPEGEMEGEIVSSTSANVFANSLFYLGSNNFFKPYSDGKDVYLEKTELFTSIDKVRINDDQSGSNEENKGLISYDYNTVFPVWKDEEKSFGIKIDKNGNFIDEKIRISSPDILFFPDGKLISTWIKKINDSTYNAGYSILNQDFTEIFSKPLYSGLSSYNVSIQAKIISDSTIIFLLKTYEDLKLILENKNGTTIKEKIIASEQNIYDGKIFFEESKAFFWILWNDNLQKYGYDLEPITDIKNTGTPYAYNNYIGNDRFLIVTTAYVYPFNDIAVLGTIVNSNGDTLANNLHLAYGKSSDYNLLIDRLDENEFLVTWKNSNRFYGRAFPNDGIAAKDSFLINRNSYLSNKELNFVVNDNKVYFTWSAAVNTGSGFDIYGSIFNLNTITSINAEYSSIPKDYHLYQNYPNPFNPSTKIKFDVPEFSHVSIKIYDILGKEIYSLLDEDKPAGTYFIEFDGINFASGVYFYKITAENFSVVRKMMLIK